MHDEQVTTLVLVSPQRLFCDCLAARLGGSGTFAVAGRSGDLEQGIATARRRGAQLLLVDGTTLDERGYDLLAELEDLKTVVLGLSGGVGELRRCAEAGVHGYAYRDTPFDELTATLSAVVRGRRVCGPRATREVFSLLARFGRRDRRRDQMDALRLTPRQMEVLRLMAKGLGNLKIAGRLDEMVDAVVGAVRVPAPGSLPLVARAARRIEELGLDERRNPRSERSEWARLTDREEEVLALVARGLSNKEVAHELGIRNATVKNQVHAILTKLGVRRRRNAVRLAYESGLLEGPFRWRPLDEEA